MMTFFDDEDNGDMGGDDTAMPATPTAPAETGADDAGSGAEEGGDDAGAAM